MTAFSKHIGKAYHISQRYQNKWINCGSSSILNDTNEFKNELKMFRPVTKSKHVKSGNEENLFDCTDKDEVGLTSFLAHTIENSEVLQQKKTFKFDFTLSKKLIKIFLFQKPILSFKFKSTFLIKFGSPSYCK